MHASLDSANGRKKGRTEPALLRGPTAILINPMTFCTLSKRVGLYFERGVGLLACIEMDFTVEVLETDLPAAADTISCALEALGNSEVLTQRAGLLEDGVPNLPVLKFRLKKGCSHVSLAFTASCEKQEDYYLPQATSSGKDIGYGLYPVTLYNPDKIQLGSLSPSNMTKKTHLVYLSKTREHGHAANVQEVVGKLSFKIRFKTTKTFRRKEKGSWLGLKSVERELSQQAPPELNLEEMVSRENSLSCNVPIPAADPKVSVIFHSVSTKISEVTSTDLLCIACIGTSAEARESAIFNKGEGPVHTLPALRPIRLRCTSEGGEVTIKVINIKEKSLVFSVSCPVAKLVPFQHYNWEYNWRCLLGPSGFNPAHSHSNSEANVTVSLVLWPSLSEHQDYEGLEVYINGVDFDKPNGRIDLVLCCELTHGEGENDPPAEAEEDGKFPNSCITVVKCSSSDDDAVISPGYFFFPGVPSDEVHRINLSLYATPHNASPWWLTDSKASAVISLSKATTQVLLQPQNEEGIRWELANDALTNSSPDILMVKRASGLLRWKSKGTKFLSEDNIHKIPDLPLLSDIEVPDISEISSVSQSDVSEVLSTRPATEQVSNADSDTALLTRMMHESALAKLGKDILKLREENELLRRENQDFEKYILEMEASIIVTAADQAALQFLTKNDLIHKVVELSQRLSTEIETRKTFQSKVQRLQNTLIKKNVIESRYMELQEAHVSQQKLVRELQGKLTKYRKCADTCKQQEAVIGRLEALLENERTEWKEREEIARLRTPLKTPVLRRKQESAGSVQDLKYELLKAKRRYHDLDEELAARLRSGRVHSTTSSKDGEEDSVRKLEVKLKMAASKEKAMMQELKEKATEKLEYELELSRLKRRRSFSKKQVDRERWASDSSTVRPISQEHSAATRSHGRRSPTAVSHQDYSQHPSQRSSTHSSVTQHSLHHSSQHSSQHPSVQHSSRHSLQHPSQHSSRHSSQHPSTQQTSAQHPLRRSSQYSTHSSRHPPRRSSLLSQHSLHSELSSINETS